MRSLPGIAIDWLETQKRQICLDIERERKHLFSLESVEMQGKFVPGCVVVAMGCRRCGQNGRFVIAGCGIEAFGIDHKAATWLVHHLRQRWNNVQFYVRRRYCNLILHILDGRGNRQVSLSRVRHEHLLILILRRLAN